LRNQEDQDLRGLFGDLQASEEERVPDFRTLMDRVKADAAESGLDYHSDRKRYRVSRGRIAWGGSMLAAAAAAVLIFVQASGTSDAEFVRVVEAYSADPASGAWTSPTEGLLVLPGKDILSTVPSIGTNGWLSGPRSDTPRNER
jgi:hypothetical protein